VARDWMKAHYDCLANSKGFLEGDQVWLYCPTQSRKMSSKLQPSWEGPYKVITQISDLVCRIQWHPRVKMMVLHLDRLEPYLGAALDEQP
jgi:hypothetical protein